MVLSELVQDESDQRYENLETGNSSRQFGFLLSLIETAISMEQPWLSQKVIKALNYHAIACLHDYAGEYRPCPVTLGADHDPPPPHAVPAQMDQFINLVNWKWEGSDPVTLAAFVLWRLNHIHPFINGNGRTARAAAYFVLCLKLGGNLAGTKTLPELICENREECVAALQAADKSYISDPKLNLSALTALLNRLISEQLNSSKSTAT
jgi:fido (protein-threonine AMPylation protein)